MRPVRLSLLVGILSGAVATILQIFWTPANTVIWGAIPLAILAGGITGWIAQSNHASSGRILAGSLAGLGVLIGLIVGGIIYLNLPTTHPILFKGTGTDGNYIAEDLILPLSGFVGFVGLGLAILASVLTGAFVQKRLR